jgi:hypothetical protein
MQNSKGLQKHLLPVGIGVLLVLSIVAVVYLFYQKPVIAPTPDRTRQPGSQILTPGEPLAAEVAGLTFLDRAIAYGESPNDETESEVLELLAPELLAQFSTSTQDFDTQLLSFLQLSQWPDQGFSEEDLQFEETTASLIAGFNFSANPRVLRELQLAHFDSGWKVTGVMPLATYPPESN